jgi:hypothetical protein
MLGKLFSVLPSTGTANSRPANTLDSYLEDHFTHNLLFPDADALCHNDQVFPLSSGTILTPASINAFDVNGEIDLEVRDVRVIIMQEATPTSGSAYLLYDSFTPPTPIPAPSLNRTPSNSSVFSSPSDSRRSISSPRKASVGQNSRPVVIQQEREREAPRAFGAFDRRQTQHIKGMSYNETEGQRSVREYREEMTTISNCIFGNSEVLAYKGTGTKVHILPSESRSIFTSGSYMGEGSLGRSSMRSSKLAQSFTSDAIGPVPTAGFTNTSTASRGNDRKKVLITRMFPVALPNDDAQDSQTQTPTGQTGQVNYVAGYPFPDVGNAADKKRPQPKQKRTPMYAVGLVVHLPSNPAPTQSVPASRSSFRGPGSYNEHESCPSSFNSSRRTGWTMLGHGFGVESLESSMSSDVDDRIDTITQHWDIIMRTLSHLQAVATASLLPMLKQADTTSPDARQTPNTSHTRTASISISGKRVTEDIKSAKAGKTNAKLVQLTPHCLMSVQTIQKEVEASRQRIFSGIKTSQVVTGQGRWGIWREEARLVSKWAGSKDEGFFFYNLLTGFLGNHTEWLQALGPSWYRRRHYQQQRANKDDDISLPARTIIVSDNKLMARRLIFLLSAFLPANQQLPSARLHRPSTSTSFGGYSQSPPAYPVLVLREESLRRRMNKRSAGARGHHSRTMSFPAQIGQGNLSDNHHSRRTSDALSIKTANLPIPGSDIGTQKSSTATTSTVTPTPTVIPHFSTRRARGTGPDPRPGSSGSLATDDLIRSLQRGDSSGQFSTNSSDSHGQNSRWGSMISGFWSSKRRDSTADTSPPSVDGLEIHDPHYKVSSTQNLGKLSEMAEEVSRGSRSKMTLQQEREMRKSESGSGSTARPDGEDKAEAEGPEPGTDIREHIVQVNPRIPDPTGAFQSPVKTSISSVDGVIDIDVPLPDYLSLETAVSSPSSSGYSFGTAAMTWGIGNGMEGFEHYSRASPDAETTLNVGGWLPRYNPDFALQAVPKQDDLMEEIKASMRAEPTPITACTPHLDENGASNGGRWVEISSAIIADTKNFSIKHISYRRLIKPLSIAQFDHPSLSQSLDSRYGNVYQSALLTPSVDLYDGHLEEAFVEEPIISMDETLIEAVERIMAQSNQGSKGSSACSSRSTSQNRKARDMERSDSGAARKVVTKERVANENTLEVPRNECKKTVLTALEDIVRSVVDGREKDAHAENGEAIDRERIREKESFLREGVRAWLGSVEC